MGPLRLKSEKPSRNYRHTKLRAFRFDKRRPKGIEVLVKTDLGDKEQTQRWSSPRLDYEDHTRLKKKTGNWQTLYNSNGLKIRYSKSEDRFYIYFNDRYITEISRLQLYDLGFKALDGISAVTKTLYWKRDGRSYWRMTILTRKRLKKKYN